MPAVVVKRKAQSASATTCLLQTGANIDIIC
jgi:hypothetical protein